MNESNENKYKGECLCGAVQFAIKGKPAGIYQCHCSECRKITGTSSNASCIVPAKDFRWVKGEANISSYTHVSGYRSDFCRTCGALLPNEIAGTTLYWVPVGALASTQGLEVKAHLCISSKADWEKNLEAGIQYPDVPSFQELLKVIGAEGNEI